MARRLASLDRAGQLDGAAEQQQLLGQRGLAGVRVRDDREACGGGLFRRSEFMARHRGVARGARLYRIRAALAARRARGARPPRLRGRRPPGNSRAACRLAEAMRLVQADRRRLVRPHFEEHFAHAAVARMLQQVLEQLAADPAPAKGLARRRGSARAPRPRRCSSPRSRDAVVESRRRRSGSRPAGSRGRFRRSTGIVGRAFDRRHVRQVGLPMSQMRSRRPRGQSGARRHGPPSSTLTQNLEVFPGLALLAGRTQQVGRVIGHDERDCARRIVHAAAQRASGVSVPSRFCAAMRPTQSMICG